MSSCAGFFLDPLQNCSEPLALDLVDRGRIIFPGNHDDVFLSISCVLINHFLSF